jgi:CubicO group peptidase (beta-lactamase class C family)
VPPERFATVAVLAGQFQRRGGQPGLAYGIVIDGRLAHAEGLGERWLGGPVPDQGTVFRIASMTKSFTAAAVLALRDDGRLALDDPAEAYIPELRGLRPAAGDAPRVTIRHLLTMTAGFPTDDPWGDRQQGLPVPEFLALLRQGAARFAWAPGTRFEYSNLGYAILGQVIRAASGSQYPDFVAERLLRPLGMAASGFDAAGFGSGELACGYRRDGEAWAELQPDPCGAFAPMGGIFSSITDLARWVAGLAGAFPPGCTGAGDAHPLDRASRREMQLAQAVVPPAPLTRFPAAPAVTGPTCYGLGLFTEEHPVWGTVVQHSGGYPGFGSHMRWHPATGLGVIVLANSTYAAAPLLAGRMMQALLRQDLPRRAGARRQVTGPAPAPGRPWPETGAAREQVMRLLQSWDDSTAAALFAANVPLDEPFARRRRTAEQVRERIGEFAEHPGRPAEHDSPAHCRWWLQGEHGVAAAEIQLSPQDPPRVQSLRLAVPPAVGSPLAGTLDVLIGLLNAGARDWPRSLAAAPSLDTAELLRRLAMAAAWAGRCELGAFRAGDGLTTATAELDGQTSKLVLAVAIEPVGPLLLEADLMLAPAAG